MADEGGGTTIVIKKIKKGGHGHHGGAWKVAYADFVTAMMAFFLTMWIMGLSQKDKEGIQKFFNDPMKYLFGATSFMSGFFDMSRTSSASLSQSVGSSFSGSGKGVPSRFKLVTEKLQKDLVPVFKEEIFDIEQNPESIKFALTAESLFSPGSTLLRPESEALLSKLADVLKNVDGLITIEAHTDDLPPDNPKIPTNWELSALRSATVVRYFVEGHYFPASKIKAQAAAEFKPIGDNRTPAGRARNRRIDIFIDAEPLSENKNPR